MKKIVLTVMMMASLSSFAFEDDIYGSSDVTFTLVSGKAMDRDKLYKKDMKRIQKEREKAEMEENDKFNKRVREFLELIRKYNKYMSQPLNKEEMLNAAKKLAKNHPFSGRHDYFITENNLRELNGARQPGQYLDEVVIHYRKLNRFFEFETAIPKRTNR